MSEYRCWVKDNFFPNEFQKICERLQSGQQRHFGSTVEVLIIQMFTMTWYLRKRESGHSKFHLSDLLLTIAVYFGDATPFSLTISQSAGAVEYTNCNCKTPNKCPGYETKQSDGEVPVMLGLWGIRSTPSLPLLPGPLCPGMVAPDWALSMD